MRASPFLRDDTRPLAGPVRLALGLWGLLTLAHMALLASGDVSPWLLVLPPVWTAHGLILTAGLEILIRRSEDRPDALRWLIVAGAVVVFTAVQTWLDALTTQVTARLIVRLFSPDPFGAAIFFWNGEGVKNVALVISVVIYFWVFGCYAVASTLLMAERRLARTQAAAARAEMMALRFQLNPHLLFNALNSVSSLMVGGRVEDADRANTALAGFLRRSLESDPTAAVSLDDELATIDAYLDIERLRFGDALEIVYDVDEAAREARLPPYMLQPLIENAVKHGLAPGVSGRVLIAARVQGDRLRIQIENTVGDGCAAPPGTGTGLANVRARLDAIYGPRAALETRRDDGVFEVVLDLPLD